MTQPLASALTASAVSGRRDIGFAAGIVAILCVFFLPVPPLLIDLGLSVSIALSVLILMVALWIERPLDFSAFPVVLLIATLLRLALNIATTRLILAHGSEGVTAAGYIIGGFSRLVMSGDFVIGLVVFSILITVNFLVITKGATRIAEVGARFTLDAIPGKQMAIDADLSAGVIDEREAQRRRRELEEESAFFGSMDGASKFVRGDAIAGLIILAVNIFGGIVIGVTRHNMSIGNAADIFARLSVGDGLVSQIPALIVSLAAGLLVSKGGTRGRAGTNVLDQLGHYPRALTAAALLLGFLALIPGLPFLPFAALGGVLGALSRRQPVAIEPGATVPPDASDAANATKPQAGTSEPLRPVEIELRLGKQLATRMLAAHGELAHRVARMRRKFARQYGFVIPEIRMSDSLTLPPKAYQIRIYGTIAATHELRLGDVLVMTGDGRKPDLPHEPVREPAFGMKAVAVSETLAAELRRAGFTPVDNMSVLLTHLGEALRNNLAQLLTYRDMRALFDRLEPEYRRLIDEISPAHISQSGLQAVLKLLLAERVSIRNLPLILEAIAEIAPVARRTELVVEHVRMRMAAEICGDLSDGQALKVLRLGSRWDLAFHQGVRRDPRGEILEFNMEPRQVEQFSQEAATAIRERLDQGHAFAIVTAPDARIYVRMILERLFATLPVLSHLEIARGVELRTLGSIS